MHANPGDWLVVEGRATVRRGLIEEVHGADGGPPFFVHWLDNGHRALIFPGPEAYVLSAEELRAHESGCHYRKIGLSEPVDRQRRP
ncbi:DUF1918 domain-containing protein [Nocardia sp. NBC_01377]|uniref:DUF1918 domain-containing protein n=1 Tax=Nocardia sp. NBC_01377 TaxID=2903595 RepID=UPI00325135E1